MRIKLLIASSVFLVIASCTPAKIETRVVNDGYGPKVYLINTSKTKKYQYTIKDIQTIVHNPINNRSYKEVKYHTNTYTLNPGQQRYIGRSEYKYHLSSTCSNHKGCKSYYEYKVVGYLEIK